MTKKILAALCVTGVSAQESFFWKDTFEKANGWDVKQGKLTFYGDLVKPDYNCKGGNTVVQDMVYFCGFNGAGERPTFESSKGHTQQSFDFIYRELDKREGEGYETHVESCMAGFAEQNCETGADVKELVKTAVTAVKAGKADASKMVVGPDGVARAEYVTYNSTCESCPDFFTAHDSSCSNQVTLANWGDWAPSPTCYGGKPIPCKPFAYETDDATCEKCSDFFWEAETDQKLMDDGYQKKFCANCDWGLEDHTSKDYNKIFGVITLETVRKLSHPPTCYAGKSYPPSSSSSAMVPYFFSAAFAIAAYFVV